MKRPSPQLISALLLLFLLSGTICGAGATTTSDPAPSLEKIAFNAESGISEYKLRSNGLQVLLAERHHTPIVTVMVVYHVGSRNEAVGYTGSTHFLEHMMFKGTAKHDPLKGTGLDDVLKPIGGINNATTFYDRTNYFETIPAEYMPVALEIEADRMRNALLRQSDRNDEMEVVRNELERNEDDPGRLMDVNPFAQAFQSHPYHHPVIGWRSDVENVPTERLRKFYNDFYYPNNATLVVIGDFKSTTALSYIEKYFSPIKPADNAFPKVYTEEPKQLGIRRFVVRKGEDLPKVVLGFHVPEAKNKDTYALEVAASLLGDEHRQSSRLYKSLIDPGTASEVYAFNYSLRDPSLFTMMATATPGASSDKIESELLSQAQELGTDNISDEEFEKAKQSVWKHLKLDAADPMGMSSQLAESIAVADWKWWLDFEKNIKSVTKADVAAVAKKYFTSENMTVGHYYPNKEKEEPAVKSTPASLLDLLVPDPAIAFSDLKATPKAAKQTPTAAPVPKAISAPRASIAAQVKKKLLANGMTVLVLQVKGSGIVSVAAKVKGGNYFRINNLQNVADFTAEMLDKGSASWSKDKMAEQLELMGTSLNFNARNFWIDFNSDIVREDFSTFLTMVSDVGRNPLFPKEELDKLRKQADARIQAAMSDTSQVASTALYGTLYKDDCVYYMPPFSEQKEQVQRLQVEDLQQFHKLHVTPANTTLAVVGDIDPDSAFAEVEKAFGSWSGPPADKIEVTSCAASNFAGKVLETNIPDKTNVDVMMGLPAAYSIKSADFYAAAIANSALGHDTISSRLAQLRTKYGLTYGIGSYFTENAFESGAWLVSYTVNPENLNKSMPLVDSILSKYRTEGISQRELSEEAQRLGGEYVVERMRTPRQLADALTKYELLGLGAKFMDEYPLRLRAVTKAQADEAIRKYFDQSKAATSIAGTIKKP